MQTHQAPSKRSPNPATVAAPPTIASNAPEPHSAYGAWVAPPKRSIADLVDDADALADWHRNLARLRAQG